MNLLTIVTTIFLTASAGSLAQTSTCSDTDALAAEKNLDRLRTWADLQQAFRRFGACDDGALAEGWDDFVARTLARQWDRLGELKRLTDKDKNFRAFVIHHIGDTADSNDLDRARVHARERCPRGAARLCQDIANAVTALDTAR